MARWQYMCVAQLQVVATCRVCVQGSQGLERRALQVLQEGDGREQRGGGEVRRQARIPGERRQRHGSTLRVACSQMQ
jgi:hypothetical protein